MHKPGGMLIDEVIGTFALCFVGAGAIIGGNGLLAIALAHGLILSVMISALGPVSGGHFNPAVTIGFIVTGKQEAKIGGFYNIGFQVIALKGIKIFTEIEFRSYGAAPMNDSFNLENNNVEFVNTLPPFSSNYNDAKFSKEWLKDLVSQGIRFGLKFNF